MRNWDFWVEKTKIGRFEQTKNFNNPEILDTLICKNSYGKNSLKQWCKHGKLKFLMEDSRIGMFKPKNFNIQIIWKIRFDLFR